jgi:16S rRNA (guanine(1405)-N(7))-methyltransferase
MNDAVADIVAGLRESKKYRDVSASVLERIAHWALARYDSKVALKAAKRKLHQVYSAYCPPGAIARLKRLVDGLPPPDHSTFRDTCRELLRGHASTAERLPHMETLYPQLWELTGPPQSVVDLACGFHPFALPWMGLPTDVRYVPCDIDERLIEQINSFLRQLGRPTTAECRDVLGAPIEGEFDVALLFKSLPCLEQQDTGAGIRLLKSLPARAVVVSFPTASLGGISKGMRRNYGKSIDALAFQLNLKPALLEIPGEVFVVLGRS